MKYVYKYKITVFCSYLISKMRLPSRRMKMLALFHISAAFVSHHTPSDDDFNPEDTLSSTSFF